MKEEEYVKIEPIEIGEEKQTPGNMNIAVKKQLKTIIYDNNFTNHHYGTTTSFYQRPKMELGGSAFTGGCNNVSAHCNVGAEFKSKSCERLCTNDLDAYEYKKKEKENNAEETQKHVATDNNNFDCLNTTKKLNYSKSLKLVQQQEEQKKVLVSTTAKSNSIANNQPQNFNANKIAYQAKINNLNDRTNLIGNVKSINNVRKFNETTNNEPSWKELAQRKHTAW